MVLLLKYAIYNFTKFSGLLGFEKKMAFAEFEGNLLEILIRNQFALIKDELL